MTILDRLAAEMDAERSREPPPLLIRLGDLVADARPLEYVVGGLIERDGIGIWHGPSETYKTFALLDAGLCVAAGIECHGRPVQRAPVVLVVGEGLGGIGRRCAAWLARNRERLIAAGVEPDIRALPIMITRRRPSLFDPEQAIAIGAAVQQFQDQIGQAVGLIGIDTLSKTIGQGNENSTSDAQVYLNHVHTLIREPTWAGVVIIHHPGRGETERMRGSYVLEADTDAAVRFERAGLLVANAIPERCKEGEVGAAFSIRLDVVPLLLGGRECSSLAIVETSDYAPPEKESAAEATGGGKHARAALDIVQKLAREQIERCWDRGAVPATIIVAELEARERFCDRNRDMREDAKRQAWHRAKGQIAKLYPMRGGGFVLDAQQIEELEA